jgi:hypothetical protein
MRAGGERAILRKQDPQYLQRQIAERGGPGYSATNHQNVEQFRLEIGQACIVIGLGSGRDRRADSHGGEFRDLGEARIR